MRRRAIVVTGLCCALNACGGDDKSNADGSGGGGGTGGSGGNASGSASGGSASGGSASTSTGGSASGGSGTSDVTSGVQADSGGSGGHQASGGAAGGAGEPGGAGEAGMASEGGTGGAHCSIGEVQSPATPETLDLFGAIQYYADGMLLPAGRYRVRLVDGCMKYASVQDWTIHAYAAPGLGWFLGAATGEEFVRLPGTIGYLASNGAYTDFEACVAANQQVGPVEFDFAGGMLGIWLKDDNYGDNVAGLDGRNPIWELVRLSSCD